MERLRPQNHNLQEHYFNLLKTNTNQSSKKDQLDYYYNLLGNPKKKKKDFISNFKLKFPVLSTCLCIVVYVGKKSEKKIKIKNKEFTVHICWKTSKCAPVRSSESDVNG